MARLIKTDSSRDSLHGYLELICGKIAENEQVEVYPSVTSTNTEKINIPLSKKANKDTLESLIAQLKKETDTSKLKELLKKTGEKEIGFFSSEKSKGANNYYPLKNFAKPRKGASGDASGDASGGASGGAKGRYTEVLSESFFCVYAAFCKKGGDNWNKFKKLNIPFLDETGKPLNWTSFKKWITDNGIGGLELQLGDGSFEKGFNDEQESFFREKIKSDGISPWHKALIKQAEKIKPYLTKSGYVFVRADNIPSDNNPYEVYNVYGDLLKETIGFSKKLDGDKWNPADVWIYVEKKMVNKKELINDIEKLFTTGKKPKSRTQNLATVEEKEYTITNPAIFDVLNDKIYTLAKEGSVIPVSLKKPGQNVYLKVLNDKDSEIVENFKFTGIKFLASNSDIQLEFRITYRNKKDPKKIPSPSEITGVIKMKTISGGLRLEIIFDKFSARMGSIGTENYSYIIYMTDRTGITKIKQLRVDNGLNKKIGLQNNSGPNWFGGLKYKSLEAKKQKLLKDYVIDLYDAIVTEQGAPGRGEDDLRNQNDPKWIATKAAAGEIGLALKGMGMNKAEKAVKAIFHLASSQGFYIPGNQTKNMQILNSCYHIKLY